MDFFKCALRHGKIFSLIPFITLIISYAEGAEYKEILQNFDLPAPFRVIERIEVYPNSDCNKTLQQVQLTWDQRRTGFADVLVPDENSSKDKSCTWTKVYCRNQMGQALTQVLYFPKGWQNLQCYLLRKDGTFDMKQIGIRQGTEVLEVTLPPRDSLMFFVKYPEPTQSYAPAYTIREMSESEFLEEQSRSKYKFLLLGAMLFPFLFFLAQFAVQRDKLSFYYLIFLVGSVSNLLTILDTIPFFELSTKIVASIRVLQHIFVLSTFLTLTGLVKYIHIFLDVSSRSLILVKAGNLLLIVFLVIVLVPVINPVLFRLENYESYLQYFRVWALLLLLYVLMLSIWAFFKRVEFSRILLLAFSPLMLSSVWYAISFIVAGGFLWLSLESLVLIIGFISTLLLFGVLLGIKTNAIKSEKLLLEQRVDQLLQLDQAKKKFYANITHDFRTPLTVIKGMADEIRGQDKIKVLIKRNSDRLLTMVTQLLDLTKVETSNMSLNNRLDDIIPYLQYLTESCHSLAINKKISLSFFSKEESLFMDFDVDVIQHILTNLLSNAIKFTPEYGSVKVVASRVTENNALFLDLTVSDTGRGIPGDQIPYVFNRYYRVDDAAFFAKENPQKNLYSTEGSGIGLALVKELVQLLQGHIKVVSEVDRGSQFKIFLPIHADASRSDTSTSVWQRTIPDSLHVEDPGMAFHPTSLTGKPVLLIIEDNYDVTEYIKSFLNSTYVIQTAQNGILGLEKAMKLIPDVILCDVMMPEMDGFEVCRQVKSDKRTSHIPIILLTARATQEDKVTGLSYGVDAYLVKPFDKEELLVRLSNLTALSKKMQEYLTNPDAVSGPAEVREEREAAFLREIQDIIDANLANEIFDTRHLCRDIAMSRTQLHRKLKALTGQSTAHYIRSRRLHQARYLIETTDLLIGEIAEQVGFRDFSHFSKAFGKVYGKTPSQLRN